MQVLSAVHIGNELKELKTQALKIGEELGVKCPLSVLPMHVSLKKGFEIDPKDFGKCVSSICGIYSTIRPFPVEVEGLELSSGIIWLRLKESRRLFDIHATLAEMGLKDFGIEPDDLDYIFKYHSTIFMDKTADLRPAFDEISKVKLPKQIMVREFIVGTTVDGRPESYAEYRRGKLGPFISIKDEWNRFAGV